MSGISPQYADGLELRIRELNEQVEKLTKERDELHRAFNQPVPQSEWEKMQEQLAALAEQNEKMRETLTEAKSMVGHPDNIAVIDTALSLPNLATPVLNRIKAEGMRDAAMHCSKHG